jgi:hypothetical protein
MNKSLLLLIFAIFIMNNLGQNDTNYMPNNPFLQCATNNTQLSYAINDIITFCIQLTDTNSSTSLRMVYNLSVDTYSAVKIAQGFAFYNTTTTETSIFGSIQNYSALNRTILMNVQASHSYSFSGNASLLDGQGHYFPLFSAVVYMNNGQVQTVFWDNGCYDGYDSCVLDVNNVTLQNAASDTCFTSNFSCPDPIVYVSFMGTDKNGVKLTSAGMRISRFRQFSIGTFYGTALGVIDKSVTASGVACNQTGAQC